MFLNFSKSLPWSKDLSSFIIIIIVVVVVVIIIIIIYDGIVNDMKLIN